MRRNHPFFELFGNNRGMWTADKIDDFMEAADSDVGSVTEGRRVENVNGEVTEYILRDGEWVEVGQDSDTFDVMDTDDGQVLTADLSGKIRDGLVAVDASINNGILNVSFEATAETESDE